MAAPCKRSLSLLASTSGRWRRGGHALADRDKPSRSIWWSNRETSDRCRPTRYESSARGHRVDGAGYDGQDPVVAGWRGQRASRPAVDSASDRAGARVCSASSTLVLYRWVVLLPPGDSPDLSRSRAHGSAGASPVTSLAPPLHCAGRETLHPAAGGQGRTSRR